MSGPKVAGDSPRAVEVKAGKAYMWCACGLSNKQPFCDGSHSKTEVRPLFYKSEKTEVVYFCMCKSTKSAPLPSGV